MTRREQAVEAKRNLDEAMEAAGTVEHVSQLDVPKAIWWLCKAVCLLLEDKIKNKEK